MSYHIKMNIVYFFTFGYSLKTWKESGQLDREVEHFKYWKKLNPDINLTIVTYGNENDINLIKENFITVIPMYKNVKSSNSKIIDFIKSFFIFKNLKKLTLGKSFDILIQNQLLGSWISYQFKRATKTPMIIRTGYDMYEFSINENKSVFKKGFYRLLTKISLRFSDLYTVTSDCDKNFLIEQFGKNYISKIKVRKNWVSSTYINPLKPFDERYDDKIVCIGRLEDQKNYETIIKALNETNYKLDIFGEGAQKNHLIQLAKTQNVDVNFKGIIENNELKELLKNYKYYLTASKFEGNPKSVLEAMSAGCLVIASDIKNHTEFLNNKNSILFKEENSLSKILINLNSNQDDFINLTENALLTIKEKYDLKTLAKQEVNDIKKIAGIT